MTEATPDRGFIPFDRALFESELFRSFTAQQRAVVFELYGLANWSPRLLCVRGEPVEVGRGEMVHSLRTIAGRIPGCTKDVVDGVVRSLQRWGYVEARHPTAEPTGPRVLTLRRYCGNVAEASAEPTAEATPSRQRADSRADSEPTIRREKQTQHLQERKGEVRASAPIVALRPGTVASPAPEAGDVLEMAQRAFQELRGARYGLATANADRADQEAAERVLTAAGGALDEVERRWRAALVHEGFPRVDTLADLARHWPRFSPSPADARRRLAAPPPPPKRRLAEAGAACPQWGRLAEHVRSRLRPDLFERWFAGMDAAMDGGDLVLTAPDRYTAEFVQDNYVAFLNEEVRALGRDVAAVRVVAPRTTGPTQKARVL